MLEGGITNCNFLVNFGGADYVVRLDGRALPHYLGQATPLAPSKHRSSRRRCFLN